MHTIKDRAVVVDGQIVIRPIMVVALTHDHRLLDGREAVTFLGRFAVSCTAEWTDSYSLQWGSKNTLKTLRRCSLLFKAADSADHVEMFNLVYIWSRLLTYSLVCHVVTHELLSFLPSSIRPRVHLNRSYQYTRLSLYLINVGLGMGSCIYRDFCRPCSYTSYAMINQS